MAITPLKSIRKGKIWCVFENSAKMLQDMHQTFKNWKENGKEKWTWGWQPPSKNGANLIANAVTFDPFLEGGCQLQIHFLDNFPPLLKGLVPILQHSSWIFQNTPAFSLSDGFQRSYGHVNKDPPFLTYPVCTTGVKKLWKTEWANFFA